METEAKEEIISGPEALLASIRQSRERIQRQIEIFSFKWRILALFAIAGPVVLGFMVWIDSKMAIYEPWFWLALLPAGAISGVILYVVVLTYARVGLQLFAKSLDRQLALAGADKLQENLEEDFFTKLVKINFKYIDQYYLQTQAQADKSFTLSATVATVALVIIIAGIVLMFLGKTTPAYLTTAAGVLGEFIAAVFFYLYNRTIIKMSEYHEKLVLTQNVSLALKIAEGLPDSEKVVAQQGLIRNLSENINSYLVQKEPSQKKSLKRNK